MKLRVLGVGALLLFQGCTYAISPDLASRADKNISFETIENDPETYKGKLVILGGTIVQTANIKQNTMLEVEQKPLDYWGKPKRTQRPGGRFKVLYTGYLNAMVYAPGREITVAAEVEGSRSKALGDNESGILIVLSKELKLWPRERQTWDKPQYMDPLLYDPYNPNRQY